MDIFEIKRSSGSQYLPTMKLSTNYRHLSSSRGMRVWSPQQAHVIEKDTCQTDSIFSSIEIATKTWTFVVTLDKRSQNAKLYKSWFIKWTENKSVDLVGNLVSEWLRLQATWKSKRIFLYYTRNQKADSVSLSFHNARNWYYAYDGLMDKNKLQQNASKTMLRVDERTVERETRKIENNVHKSFSIHWVDSVGGRRRLLNVWAMLKIFQPWPRRVELNEIHTSGSFTWWGDDMLLNTIPHELMRLLPAFIQLSAIELSSCKQHSISWSDNSFPVTETPHTDELFYYSHTIIRTVEFRLLCERMGMYVCVCVCILQASWQ